MIEKKDYLNDDYNLEITDPQIASTVFNIYLKEKGQSVNKKDRILNDYKRLYDTLPKEKKYVVNNLIKNLISKDYLQQNFGAILSQILEDKNVTTYELAKLLYGKSSCDEYHGIENEYSTTLEDLRSLLENFKKIQKPQDKSITLILDLCDVLSVELDLLTTGVGVIYDIDEEKILTILKEKELDIDKFFNDILKELLKCSRCKRDGVCDWQEQYIRFMQSNKVGLGELIAKKLGVPSDEIIIEDERIFELEEFPLERYFSKLKTPEQRAVKKLISDLHIS